MSQQTQGEETSLVIDKSRWGEHEQDAHVRSLYKAEKLLGDVVYRLNMYMLASQHYSYLNRITVCVKSSKPFIIIYLSAVFVTPSIIITSIASFLSFVAATDPVRSKDISLVVGFLGTLATIVTALQSSYKFDTMSETFRTAAAEYRLLNTRVVSVMRKEKVYPEEWELLWDEIETRMTEMQKKLKYFPNRDLVDGWAREGKLSEKTMSGSMMPPWLIRFQEDLEDDGIQEEQDIKFISDEIFEVWSQPLYMKDPQNDEKSIMMTEDELAEMGEGVPRYPKVVISKLREKRDWYEKQSNTKKKTFTNIAINMNPTTMAALRKRGIYVMNDFRLATDDILDSVIDELIQMDTPPMPVAWANLEDTVAEVRHFGFVNPFCKCFAAKPNARAENRMNRVNEANHAISQAAAARLANASSKANRSSRIS